MNTAARATGKQVALITSLVKERNVKTFPAPLVSVLSVVEQGTATAGQASWAIEALFKTPKAGQAHQNATPAALGYYLHEGNVYVVTKSKVSGKVYAKQMVVVGAKGKWEYVAGMVFKLTASEKLTVARAAELGHLLGCCMICGATLTDPKSVEQGIGPVCMKKLEF
jgi:hypothetical protein